MSPRVPLVVVCVACRERYEQGTAPRPGCPRCGSRSWVAAWITGVAAQAREM